MSIINVNNVFKNVIKLFRFCNQYNQNYQTTNTLSDLVCLLALFYYITNNINKVKSIYK